MNPERWEQIKQVYHAALELEPDRREKFLKEACAGDEPLFKEVTSLLAQDGKSEGLFDSPALDAVARAVAEDEAHKPPQNLTGHILLHYRIEKKIGQGGMGEVFLAQDTSLNRKVALKFLPPEMQQDPVAHKRFLREARSAAALDNPFICSIHQVGECEGKDFIVMEYVDGQTLMEKLGRGRLPLNQALQIATEVAEALQTAHGKGIIHRDLKPSNIMLTKAGHAKVMDFGLAKQIVQPDETKSQEESVTAMTRSGMTLGTLAYMSPEQVRGEAADARSDIFSFGLVLYEMLTGMHPFRKESPMETASAILHEEPKPVGGITKGTPAELERLINRCLRKDPERRFRHIDDVKIALLEFREDSESGRLPATPANARRQFATIRLVAVVFVVVALIAAGWYWLRLQRPAEPEAPLTAVPLTSYPGWERSPSFSPDGMQVAFQWCTEEPSRNCPIYIKQIGVEQPPFRLTNDPAGGFSPAWSPDGQFIAFLRKLSLTRATLILIPQRGGQERVLGESHDETEMTETPGPYLAWTPDSKWLALAELDKPALGLLLISVETLEKRRLTTSPAGFFDTTPAFSPDGRTLAFTRWSPSRTGICLLGLGKNYEPQGEPPRLVTPEEQQSLGVAWTPDGSGIVFCYGLFGGSDLWRMAASTAAKPVKLAWASDATSSPAISRQGSRLAFTVGRRDHNIYRVDLSGPGLNPGGSAKFISSTRTECCPAYSPDGTKIAFSSDRTGSWEIWVCDSDGSNAFQLTSLRGEDWEGATWSPDGRRIVFGLCAGGKRNLFVTDANGGIPRSFTTDLGRGMPWPSWSRDGRSIYFRSMRSGKGEIWKMPAVGGEAVQMTRNEGDLPQESTDGKYLYYAKGNPYPEQCSVWRMPVGGGEETKVVESTACEGPYAVWEQGIYYFTPWDKQGRSDISLYNLRTGKTRKIVTIEQPGGYIAASPDGRTILYTQFDQGGSDLMLVENFR